MQWNVYQWRGSKDRMYRFSALWLSVIPDSVHLYCSCICLFVRVCAHGCVWLSLTASMGTRFILTLIMSERLVMPLSHFSISSLLPVSLGYTFLSLLPFSSLNHDFLSHLSGSVCLKSPLCPQLFYLCWGITGDLIDAVHLGGAGHCSSIVFTPVCVSVCACLYSVVLMFAALHLLSEVAKVLQGDESDPSTHFIPSCFCLLGD